jgi:hypothetical protein
MFYLHHENTRYWAESGAAEQGPGWLCRGEMRTGCVGVQLEYSNLTVCVVQRLPVLIWSKK